MEFWGVEIKSGEPLKVIPGDDKILHLSQASLGEVKKEKANESVALFVNVGGQKLVLGTLSREKFPQISFDLVFEKEFELSHNWKNGSVYFCGYTSVISDEYPSRYSDSEFGVDLPHNTIENGKSEPKVVQAKPATDKANAAKPNSSAAKPKVKIDMLDIGDESDDEDDDGSSEEDEETPKKAKAGKKRPIESATKTPAPEKKAKLVTPQKTDGKKGSGHTATPHPAKQSGKTPASSDKSKPQTPKSDSQVICKSCSKTFNSENALQSHSKAKHSAAKFLWLVNQFIAEDMFEDPSVGIYMGCSRILPNSFRAGIAIGLRSQPGLPCFGAWSKERSPSWEDDLIAKIQDHTLIEIEDCLLEEGKHRYQNSIVGKFLVDKPFNLMSAKKTMLQAWRSKSNITTLDLSKDMVLFMFDEVSDLNKVLANSPWAFNGHLLALQKWKEDTSVSEFVFDSISIWTQIHDLPLDWITRRIGMQLGSDIGCVEDVDIPFGGILGGKFIRIRVCINLNRPLVQFVIAKRKNAEPRFLEVKYERLPIFCFKCGKIGHDNRQCSTLTDSGGEKEATLLPFGVWLKAENGELLNPHLEHFKMKGRKISGIHPSSSQSPETELGMILSPANIPSKNPVTVLHLDSDLLVRRMMPRGGLGFDEVGRPNITLYPQNTSRMLCYPQVNVLKNPNIVGVDKMKYQSTYPEDSNNMKNTWQPQELDLEIPDIVGEDQLRNQFSYPEVSNKLKNPQQIKPFNCGNSLPKWGIDTFQHQSQKSSCGDLQPYKSVSNKGKDVDLIPLEVEIIPQPSNEIGVIPITAHVFPQNQTFSPSHPTLKDPQPICPFDPSNNPFYLLKKSVKNYGKNVKNKLSILLDGNFNPRLGDFGLALLMEHDKSPLSTLTAWTMRRSLVEAADKRLNVEFEEEEIRKLLLLGLSCANLDCKERP
ncbi:hypothetical protein HHK36_019282 [Tetracentron sinense]|uniref:CCHC-type domain-containing protein n=1 Tax=Tetracentron sinense TaxID=13715 RepID=A0A834YW01_TETSI|nr:hypothetical protein HHK36_019282 [Tetracentron sinense]